MNRRIKKKIDKRLHSGIMTKLDENKRKFYQTANTYREIKNERKAFHEVWVHFRHVTHKLIGYSQQLCDSRRLRKDRKSIYSW